jgi:hypothetical protein
MMHPPQRAGATAEATTPTSSTTMPRRCSTAAAPSTRGARAASAPPRPSPPRRPRPSSKCRRRRPPRSRRPRSRPGTASPTSRGPRARPRRLPLNNTQLAGRPTEADSSEEEDYGDKDDDERKGLQIVKQRTAAAKYAAQSYAAKTLRDRCAPAPHRSIARALLRAGRFYPPDSPEHDLWADRVAWKHTPESCRMCCICSRMSLGPCISPPFYPPPVAPF